MGGESFHKKKILLLCGGMLLVCAAIVLVLIFASGTESSGIGAVGEVERITVSYGKNPASEMNFCWYTTQAHKGTFIQYLPKTSDAVPDFQEEGVSTKEGYIEQVAELYPAAGQESAPYPELQERTVVRHRLYLSNLESGTAYWYRIGDRQTNTWSRPAVFRTAAAAGSAEPFSFLLATDSQGFVYSHFELWSDCISRAGQRHADAAFLLHLGDFVEDGMNALQWQSLLNLPNQLLRGLPVMPVAGNKDTRHVFDYFTLGSPADTEPLTAGWYSFDYADTHFTILYTGDDRSDLSKKQLKWLKQDLADSDARWKIVVMHKAPYSNANHADDKEIVALRKQLLPVFDAYGVDVVLQGHDHYYFRSAPVWDGAAGTYTETKEQFAGDAGIGEMTVLRDVRGTVYFINGSAGVKQYAKTFRDMPEICAAEALRLSDPTYSYCTVTEERFTVYTYTVDRNNGSISLVEAWCIEK